MKLYIHHEDDPEFTKVVNVEEARKTIRDVVSLFILEYNTKFPQAKLHVNSVTVTNDNGRTLDMSMTTQQTCTDKDDLFIKAASRIMNATPELQYPTQETTSMIAKLTGLSVSAPVQNAVSSKIPQSSSLSLQERDQAKQMISRKAEDAFNSKNLRSASNLYQQVLQLDPVSEPTLVKLSQLYLKAGRAKIALDYALAAHKVTPESTAILELLSEAYMAAGDCHNAIHYIDRAVSAAKKESTIRQNEVLLALSKVLHSASSFYVGHDKEDGDDSDGACQSHPGGSDSYVHGVHERCVQVVMSLVSQDESNWDYLFMYATLALDRGLLEDAIRVALRLLVQRSNSTEVKSLLAQCLMLPGGMDLLLTELSSGSGSGSAAALAFLANCIKDQGAVKEAVQLFAKAVSYEPLNSTYSLNYVHALELNHQYDDIIHEVADFCSRCKLHLGGKLESLQPVISELQACPALGHMTSLTWFKAEPWNPGTSQSHISDQVSANSSKITYSPEQLDILALLFTAIKVTFVSGALALAYRLCILVDSARLASVVELHTTLIRNEAAYFGCVLKLLVEYPPPKQPSDGPLSHSPLYLCGDSHSLSAAWQTVVLRGEPRILQPLLVTGCKIWHLRPESCFYPKVQLLNTFRKLPQGSQVIMLFGEIDCREGLLLAVEKCKYDSLDEGIDQTLEIYISVLLELIKEKQIELFVHPIAPVLNETRHIVIPFMRSLKTKVLSAANSPAAQGRLHFMDFFDKLLSFDTPSSQLLPEFEFDGTHLAPTYVRHLSAALSIIR